MSLDVVMGGVVTLGLAGVSGIVWLIRLEGRINLETKLRETEMANVLTSIKASEERQVTFENRIYLELREIKEILREKQDRYENR